MRRSSTATAVALITVLGAVVRFATLDVQSLSGDEGVTSALLRMSLGDMLATIPDTESTPPLYYVLAWVWTRVFGHGEAGMRSLSALLGAAAVPVLFAAGRALASERAGLIAAGLGAVSPLLVWYSQEARSYALLVLLAALSLWLAARTVERGSAGRLAAWAAVCALALATHYYAGFLVLGEAAWLLSRARPRAGAVVACAALGAVALALLPLALDQRSTGNFMRFVDQSALGDRIREVPKKFLVGEQGTPGDYGQPAEALKFLALGLVLVAGALLVWRARGRERSGGLAAAALAAVAAGIPLAMALAGSDYFAAYLLIAAWVPLAVAAGAGFAAGGRLGAGAAAALGAALLAISISVPAGNTLRRPDFRSAAGAIGQPREPRAIVATPDNSAAPLDHYLRDVRTLDGRTPVREVLLLGMDSSDGTFRERATGAPVPPRGFRVTERAAGEEFTLVRLRAERPRVLSADELESARLGEAPASLALQR